MVCQRIFTTKMNGKDDLLDRVRLVVKFEELELTGLKEIWDLHHSTIPTSCHDCAIIIIIIYLTAIITLLSDGNWKNTTTDSCYWE